ncbi:hypothetical protein GCM10009730_07170 [Streptomyces albidochromogenes]
MDTDPTRYITMTGKIPKTCGPTRSKLPPAWPNISFRSTISMQGITSTSAVLPRSRENCCRTRCAVATVMLGVNGS